MAGSLLGQWPERFCRGGSLSGLSVTQHRLLFLHPKGLPLLLVFISVNSVSAGPTRITTSMSCTFDLKIKLIWKVSKALLIFMRPLAVALRFSSFFVKSDILPPYCPWAAALRLWPHHL